MPASIENSQPKAAATAEEDRKSLLQLLESWLNEPENQDDAPERLREFQQCIDDDRGTARKLYQ